MPNLPRWAALAESAVSLTQLSRGSRLPRAPRDAPRVLQIIPYFIGSLHDGVTGQAIPAVQRLLKQVDLDGSLVTADALNTQSETARIVVQEKGGDYLRSSQ
ncbi:MAG TPA: hypothetical protein VHH88_05660 [Verrucomicrobiae bacterium]|nr:hypothetical protein [Verrucomicrobiae bacterium]